MGRLSGRVLAASLAGASGGSWRPYAARQGDMMLRSRLGLHQAFLLGLVNGLHGGPEAETAGE